jgi:hypothetical protein
MRLSYFMKIRPVVIVLLSLKFLSCTTPAPETKSKQEAIVTQPDSPELPEPHFVADAQKEIAFATDTLYSGDTLKIKFKTPHAKDLAITDPDGNFFFVVYAYNDPTKPSLVDWNGFENMDQLEIITNKTKVNPWNASSKENQLIFTKTGPYEINLSENLETDDGTPVEIEKVYYIHEEKKSKE